MSDLAESLAAGLAERLRTLLLTLDRQDRLETAAAFVGWLAGEREAGRLPDDARELLLRALKVAGDPVNYRLLAALDPIEPVELPALMEGAGLGRVAASERVHDMAQVGLAVRELVNDEVRGTALGAGLVALVEGAAAGAGERLAAELPRPPADREGGGA